MVRSRACLLLFPWARLCKPLVERAGYSSATQLSPLLTALFATSHAGGQPASPVFPPHHLSFAGDRWLSTSSTSLHASSKESEADSEASTNSNAVGNVSGSKQEPAKPKELRMSLQEALSSLVDAAVGMVEDNNLAGAISVLKEGIATFEPTFPASPELGELYNQVALLSLVAGDVEEAARHAEAAHDMTLRAFGPASVLTGHRALRLGVARFAQQRVKDAVGLLHTAVEALTKHRDVSQPEAQLYLDLCMLSGASDAQQVQGLQERLLASVGSMKDTFGAQSMILSLALAQHDRVVHQALGAAQLDTTLCEALLKQHIRLLESVSSEGEDLAVAQYKLATFYYVQDMQADAGAMLQQAMQGLRSIYPDDHDLVVLCKHRMGMVLAASGDHHAASQLLSLSLAHYSPSPSPGSSPAAAAAGPHNDSPGSSQGGAGMGSGGEGAGRSGLSGLALEAAFGLALAKLKALPSPSSNIPGAHQALEAAKARLAELVATVGPQHMLAKGAMRQFEQVKGLC
ncbi:hypothetical protein V8C86DRAFT_2646607 [Haematococcus lacustris]